MPLDQPASHPLRRRPLSTRVLALVFVFGLGVALASAVNLPGKYRTVRTRALKQAVDPGSAAAPGNAAVTDPGASAAPGSVTPVTSKAVVQQTGNAVKPVAKYECAPGKNGGNTDIGVSGNAIKVAANVVQDGPGASFLSEAIIGIQAVVDEANVHGICGRKILLEVRNDGWDRNRGLSYIENYIHDNNFALMVNPSSEGLDAAVENGTIDSAGIPVVGSDGMLISQYRKIKDGNDRAKWVWPVAASTVSTMHIIVQDAVARGAKTFGLVYDNQYKFGVEGAEAYAGAINRLQAEHPEIKLVKKLGIEPGKTSYNTEAEDFNGACGGNPAKCDEVAMLLDPSTAITWIKAGGTFGAQLTSGPQTLFNHAFAENCVTERRKLGKGCDLEVWTGYNPPVGALATLPGVQRYAADVQSRNSHADVENSFTEGAYLGAQLFIKALQQVGPNLTRSALRQALDAMTFQADLSNSLTWRSGQHFANLSMQSFKVGFTQERGFTGWQPSSTGWVRDRWAGVL
jgi:ABC-type branched-subunit amino acid transport system substrate-binding protein